MAKVIAFSGGCHSGKTTTLNKIADIFTARGLNVVIISELIRDVTRKPIDELRKDPSSYLNIQEQIISAKIEQEIKAFNDESDTVYLVDRAITDSLFYLQNYVDKSNLSELEIVRLCNLDFVARQHANDAFNRGYDALVMFEPLDIIDNKDTYRPKLLQHLKDYEYQGILSLNESYLWSRCDCFAESYNFYLAVNMNCNTPEFIADALIYDLFDEKADN